MVEGMRCPKCGEWMDNLHEGYVCTEGCGHIISHAEKASFFFPLLLAVLVWALILPFGKSAQSAENSDLFYMAEAIYFESRNQPLVGQVAVGCVIRNRTESNRWPNDVKDVVHQYKQFSYFFDGKDEVIRDWRSLYYATEMAKRVLTTDACAIYEGIDHYINHEIANPNVKWFSKMSKILVVGDHTFYRS